MSRWVQFLTTGQTQILAAINAILGLLIAFHVVLTEVQLGAIDIAVNAVLAVIAALLTTTAKAQAKAAAVAKK